MAHNKRCVLFQWTAKDDSDDQSALLIEQLRHAGLLKIVKETHDGRGPVFMLEMRCPDPKSDGNAWATQNARRMTSFGINAIDSYEGD